MKTTCIESVEERVENGVTLVEEGGVTNQTLGIAREGGAVAVLEIGLVPAVKVGVGGGAVGHHALEAGTRRPELGRPKARPCALQTFFWSITPS